MVGVGLRDLLGHSVDQPAGQALALPPLALPRHLLAGHAFRAQGSHTCLICNDSLRYGLP